MAYVREKDGSLDSMKENYLKLDKYLAREGVYTEIDITNNNKPDIVYSNWSGLWDSVDKVVLDKPLENYIPNKIYLDND